MPTLILIVLNFLLSLLYWLITPDCQNEKITFFILCQQGRCSEGFGATPIEVAGKETCPKSSVHDASARELTSFQNLIQRNGFKRDIIYELTIPMTGCFTVGEKDNLEAAVWMLNSSSRTSGNSDFVTLVCDPSNWFEPALRITAFSTAADSEHLKKIKTGIEQLGISNGKYQ